jgi:hypothetical protein
MTERVAAQAPAVQRPPLAMMMVEKSLSCHAITPQGHLA